MRMGDGSSSPAPTAGGARADPAVRLLVTPRALRSAWTEELILLAADGPRFGSGGSVFHGSSRDREVPVVSREVLLTSLGLQIFALVTRCSSSGDRQGLVHRGRPRYVLAVGMLALAAFERSWPAHLSLRPPRAASTWELGSSLPPLLALPLASSNRAGRRLGGPRQELGHRQFLTDRA
jgi:hypothetical protein